MRHRNLIKYALWQFLFFWVLLSGCGKRHDQAAIDAAVNNIKSQGILLGNEEFKLSQMSSPGEVALQVEKIRDMKAGLVEMRASFGHVIPMERSAAIADAAREESLDRRREHQRELLREQELFERRRSGETEMQLMKKRIEEANHNVE